jgi:hypothetical protein
MKAWPTMAPDSPHLESATADLERRAVIEVLGRAYGTGVAGIRAELTALTDAYFAALAAGELADDTPFLANASEGP